VADAKALLSASGFDTSKEYNLKYPRQESAGAVRPDRPAAVGQEPRHQDQARGRGFRELARSRCQRWLRLHHVPLTGLRRPEQLRRAYGKQIGGRPNWAGFVDEELDADLRSRRRHSTTRPETSWCTTSSSRPGSAGPYIPSSCLSQHGDVGVREGRITGRGSYGLFNGRVYIDKG
jgi:hypothetical protein